MADLKKPMAVLSQRKSLMTLMTIAICYQLVYQVVMWHNFNEDAVLDPCAYPNSPKCLEQQLFKSWQEKDAQMFKPLERPDEPVREDMETDAREQAALEDTQNKWIAEVLERQHGEAEFQKLYDTTAAMLGNRSNVTPFARSLETLQASLDARLEKLKSMHKSFADAAADRAAARHAEHLKRQVEFDRLFNETAALVHSRGSKTSWAGDLEALQAKMQRQMDELKAKHQRLDASKRQGEPSAGPSSVLERALALGRELCSEPHRRGRSVCAQFLRVEPESAGNMSSAAHNRHAKRAARRKNLTEEAKQKSSQMDARLFELAVAARQWEERLTGEISQITQELCSNPARAEYPSCQSMLREAAHKAGLADAGRATSAALSTSHEDAYLKRLQWSGVARWKDSNRLRGAGPAALTRDQLRHAKWQGAIPKVACVSVVTPTRDLAILMKYFVNNFRLQDYEGSRQLILVYPSTSTLAARVVKQVADGYFIKAVADRSGHFPSTAAFRYGAWSSDAEVIARWDLDAWHHPQRLAMQVRAMTMAARPASLLVQRSSEANVTHGADASRKTQGDKASVVGERSWMWEHWYPQLGNTNEQDVHEAQAHNIVQVQMPELLRITAGATAGSHAGDVSVASAHLACSGVVPEHAPFAWTSVNNTLPHTVTNSPAGIELGRVYESLAGRRDQLSINLNDLCTEAKQEHNQSRLELLHNRSEHIVAMQMQLDGHFSIMDAVLQ